MADTPKNYFSVFNNGIQDLYVKDAEASDVISVIKYNDVYIGTGATVQDVMISANHHEKVIRGDKISVTSSSAYLWAVLPDIYSPIIQMGGLDVPTTEQSSVTVEGVTYKVLRSSSQYTGTFSVSLI